MNEQEVKDLEAKAMKSHKLMSEIVELQKDIYLLDMYSNADEISNEDDTNACPKKIVLCGVTEDRSNMREIEVSSNHWRPMVSEILRYYKEKLDDKRRQLDEMFVKTKED